MTSSILVPSNGAAKLGRDFYVQDTVRAARAVLGKVLAHRTVDGVLTGRIVETEAYLRDDPACHGSRGLTPRCRTMFGEPGHAYVYFTYGAHHCLNLVTQPAGVPEAILVRALVPLQGVEAMRRRRDREREVELCSGPGKLTRAFGIDGALDGEDLLGDRLFVFDDGAEPGGIIVRPRIGIREAADKPWRFYLEQYAEWVSKR